MKLLIPFVLIITFVSCTDKTELYEKCADTRMKNWLEFIIDDDFSEIEVERISEIKREMHKLTLQEKLTFNDVQQMYGKINHYSKFFAECETLEKTNPTTFKAIYK